MLVTALTLACCFEREESFARGLFARAPQIELVAPLCPVLDVVDRVPSARELSVAPWLRERIEQVCREYVGGLAVDPFFASPIVALESERAPSRPLPPFFSSCGGEDPILEDPRRLARALARRGVDHEARVYSGETHAFQALYWTPQGARSWADLFDFAERLRSARGPRVAVPGSA